MTFDQIESSKILNGVSSNYFCDEDEFENEISKKGFHKLLGLKHVDYLSTEEAQ